MKHHTDTRSPSAAGGGGLGPGRPWYQDDDGKMSSRPQVGRSKEAVMGLEDKAKNLAEQAKGKVKEATGKSTGDESMQAEGEVDQSKADLKQAGEKVKDAFKD